MIEYDFMIALYNIDKEKEIYEMQFPHSAVVNLRGISEKNFMEMNICFANGTKVRYRVPVIYTQNYSEGEVLNKKLYFLIPYYILKYEKDIEKHSDDFLKAAEETYKDFNDALLKACEDNTIDSYDMDNIFNFTIQLIDYVSKGDGKIKERLVDNIMGGQVLETRADKLIARGREEGKEEGRAFC